MGQGWHSLRLPSASNATRLCGRVKKVQGSRTPEMRAQPVVLSVCVACLVALWLVGMLLLDNLPFEAIANGSIIIDAVRSEGK